MKVITVEQFQSADEKVQEALMKWWEPQMMDLYVPLDGEPTVICRQRQLEAVRKLKDEGNVPLLTEGQLIWFIEYSTNSQMDIGRCDGLTEITWYPNGRVDCHTDVETEDLLEALWVTAQAVVMS